MAKVAWLRCARGVLDSICVLGYRVLGWGAGGVLKRGVS